MGMPAARLGDPTMHGGAVAAGFPMVLIGGMPAARLGDMHVCPMVNPGTPPPPHVGGPITKGSMGVLIGNQPAARQGDMATCAGPPDTIAMGCPTVLIGEGAAGAGGGSGGGSGSTGPDQQTDANETVIGSGQSNEGNSSNSTESHFLDVKFLDKAGYPITGIKFVCSKSGSEVTKGMLAGEVKLSGCEPGSYDIELRGITEVKWSEKKARVGDIVKLTAKVTGFPSGTPATFCIFERDTNSADDVVFTKQTQVTDDNIEFDWTYEYTEDNDDIRSTEEMRGGYSTPEYYFVVEVDGICAISDLLEFRDYLEFKLKNADGNAIANAQYRIFLPNGEIRTGQLDGSGYVKIENVPPGAWDVEFPEYSGLYEEGQ